MALIIKDSNNNVYGDLKTGDLVFKNCEKAFEIGRIIQAGQGLSAIAKFWSNTKVKDARWEHAAVVVNDHGGIIEAVSGGVTISEMTNEADYIVFRCNNQLVADTSVEVAKMILDQKLDAYENGDSIFGYSLKGAIKAWANPSKKSPTKDTAEARIDHLFPKRSGTQKAGGPDLFCSQFAALCYVIGAEQNNINPGDFIERNDSVLTPNQMVSLLRKNARWNLVGISARDTHYMNLD